MKIKRKILSLGIIQCFLLEVLLLLLYFYKSDITLIFLFFYSLILGFIIIKNNNEKLLANNNALIFLIFLFLYGIFQPAVEMFMQNKLSLNVYRASIIYASSIPAYLIGSSIFKVKRYDEQYLNNISKYKNNRFYNVFLIILLVCLISYVTYFFYSIGALFNPAVLEKDRSQVFEDRSQGEVVVGLLISGIFLYFIYYYKKKSKVLLFIVFSLLLYYIALQLSAGNRRDFMPMILGAFCVFVNIKKVKFNFFMLVCMLIGIALFQYLGTIRSYASKGFSNVSKNQLIEDTFKSNEFIYPFYTLSIDVDNYYNNQLELKYGETLMYPIIFFIPRSIYLEKPYSLSNQFNHRNFNSRYAMGFAYTPVSEAFINFGPIGPVFFYLIFGLILSRVQNKKNQVLNFVLFTMIIDFSRGELGTFFYQFFFVALFIYIIPSTIKYLIPR